MKTLLRSNLLLVVLAFMGFSTQALASDPIYTGFLSSTAIGGYDTVSYFQGDGVPVKGSSDYSTEWRGATWHFSSAENLAAFTANPEQYAPQYGGYCAWATAHDNLAKGDPEVYELVSGKLYLNYNGDINARWSPRKEELIPVADGKYPNLVDL